MSAAAPLATAIRLEGRGVAGLVGQVLQRAHPGALLGLLLDHAVDQGHHRLDRQQGAEQGAGAADPPALLEVLEGVDHAVDVERGTSSATRASSSSRSAPAAASSAASRTIRPRPMVSDRVSTARTGMVSATALAAAVAAW